MIINPSLTILSADDYEDDNYLLEQAFKKAKLSSIRLHIVRDGTEAVAYLQGEGKFADRKAHPFPDILLLDLNMPRMNGFEVLKWLRKDSQFKGLIVYVLTASARAADVERAYELGVNAYIVKPSRIDDLTMMVARLHEWHHFVALPKIAAKKEKESKPRENEKSMA